jgi:hypothetical protein
MMSCRIRKILSWLLLLGSLVLLLWLGIDRLNAQPASAAVSQIEEAAGHWLYRSQQAVLDPAGNSWQVVLFKRVNPGETAALELRVVGFPGIADFAHPQPLAIAASTGEVWSLPDAFAEQSPAANVGQYLLGEDIASRLIDQSLTLSLPLKNQPSLVLKISPAMTQEWQQVLVS